MPVDAGVHINRVSYLLTVKSRSQAQRKKCVEECHVVVVKKIQFEISDLWRTFKHGSLHPSSLPFPISVFLFGVSDFLTFQSHETNAFLTVWATLWTFELCSSAFMVQFAVGLGIYNLNLEPVECDARTKLFDVFRLVETKHKEGEWRVCVVVVCVHQQSTKKLKTPQYPVSSY